MSLGLKWGLLWVLLSREGSVEGYRGEWEGRKRPGREDMDGHRANHRGFDRYLGIVGVVPEKLGTYYGRIGGRGVERVVWCLQCSQCLHNPN